MPARMSEAIVLQTYPFKESDLIVSFLARDAGKLRGVAQRARRPKSAFGSGLERLSQVRMSYFQRENRELVSLNSCDLMQSQFALASDYYAGVSLDYFAEVTEHLLPAEQPNERYFRMLLSVLSYLRNAGPGAVWQAITYFTLWAVRLAGLLPDMHACLECGSWLDDPEAPERAYFSRDRHGLYCQHCRRALDLRHTWELCEASRELARNIVSTPVADLPAVPWTQQTAADLRRFLVQQLETQIERRLITAPLLEAA